MLFTVNLFTELMQLLEKKLVKLDAPVYVDILIGQSAPLDQSKCDESNLP